MARVSLVNQSSVPPTPMASHAGRTCYEPEMPKICDNNIDVKKRLFDPGHHTTLEHNYFTFAMEDISVSTITFGFHLSHPFYNSDQRSGRFSKMYDNPDLAETKERLKKYFPNENPDAALKFIETGLNIFQKNKDSLTDLAADTLRAGRPYISDKYIEQNAKKMAQEQLRVFVSTIMPTAMDHTIDLVTLCALWRTAWTPEMREATHQMKDAIISEHPDISYMFDDEKRSTRDWAPRIPRHPQVENSPSLKLRNIDIPKKLFVPNAGDSVDILQFHPKAMNNRTSSIRTRAKMSVMTMGQDQRHRTIDRGEPTFTGAFYLPPMLEIAGLRKDAESFMKMFCDMRKKYSKHLMTAIVPYGAMVKYEKRTNLNALLHEQAKRLCWCAQEEIYNMNIQLIEHLRKRGYDALANEMLPHCGKYGKCIEGPRYCGRDIKIPIAQYFKQRTI